jgi:hypothetical protein
MTEVCRHKTTQFRQECRAEHKVMTDGAIRRSVLNRTRSFATAQTVGDRAAAAVPWGMIAFFPAGAPTTRVTTSRT